MRKKTNILIAVVFVIKIIIISRGLRYVKKKSYSNGYNKGHTEGYWEGHTDGYNECSESFPDPLND